MITVLQTYAPPNNWVRQIYAAPHSLDIYHASKKHFKKITPLFLGSIDNHLDLLINGDFFPVAIDKLVRLHQRISVAPFCLEQEFLVGSLLQWVRISLAAILIYISFDSPWNIQNTEYRILYCHFDHTCHASKGTTGNKVYNYIQHIRRLKTSYTCIVQIRTMWLRLFKKQKNDLEHIIDIWKVI